MHRAQRSLELPPGPKGPITEELARFNADPFGHLEALAAQYGTMFTLQLGDLGNEAVVEAENNGLWVFLTRPHQVRVMYEADDSVVSGAQANKVFFGTNEASVGYIDGKAHRCRRSLLHPTFNGSRDHSGLVREVAQRCMARWPRGEPFRLFEELQRLTSEIIVEVVCGNLSTEDRAHLSGMLPRTESARLSREELRGADVAVRAFVQGKVQGYLHDAQRAGSEDVLATLLRLGRDSDPSLTQEVVRDEVFSLLYTGFSTTANTLAWAFLRILGERTVLERVRRELDEVVGAGPLGPAQLARLEYLEAVLKETLRLHPVTPLNGVRMLKQDLMLDGYLLPPGTILVHCAYLLQRSADVFPLPELFVPERFLGPKLEPYAWGAFGGGSRSCVGRGFSMEEMKAVLAVVLGALELERLERVLPRAEQQGFFMAPADGARCVVRGPRRRT